MLKLNKFLAVYILSVLFILLFSSVCFGNSAQPPSILIIVSNAPDNLEIGIGSGNTYSKANIRDKGMEKYYIFYSSELKVAADYTLKVKTSENTFEIAIAESLKDYNNIFTLDLKNKTLTPGKLVSRSIILVSLRVILTLIIEAFIFYLLGFRQKNSWIAFLIINLITQGALNIWIDGFSPLGSYMIISLIFGEFFVFIFEIISFLTFVKENSRLLTFSYVMLANIISLLLGGFIITILPI
ncbi:MAG: hypothetical protein K0R31_1339 [Clostridiales bacterium]|jgi:hypothetical protein|nr:hypothetical protein [Clostridiales bacterium]